jgi:hypothetical protein
VKDRTRGRLCGADGPVKEKVTAMSSVSLTVYGNDTELGMIREALPSEPKHEWRKGDEKAGGRVHLDSGFELDIATGGDPDELMRHVRVYLTECTARGISFAEATIVAELRISLAVSLAGQTPPTLDIRLTDLVTFSELGICLSIHAATA